MELTDYSADDPSGEVAGLLAEYRSRTDEARDVEIIYQLGFNGSLGARETLAEWFRLTLSGRLKLEVLTAVSTLPGDEIAPLDETLRAALADSTRSGVREAGIDALRSLNNPKTAELWKSLLADPDESLREEARAMLDQFTEVESAK